VRDQVRLLRHEGLSIDLVHADLNVAYLWHGHVTRKLVIRADQAGNKDYVITAPFWPKNSKCGLHGYIRSYSALVDHYILKEGRPDIIHAHTYLGAGVAKKVKQQFEIPYIVTEHYTGWLNGKISADHKKLGIEAFATADQILAVSHTLKDRLEFFTKRNVQVVPNFIDGKLFGFALPPKDPPFTLLNIGDLVARKQPAKAIKIVKKLLSKGSSVQLKIIGDGPLKEELQSRVKKLGIEQSIHFLGTLSKYDVAKEIRKSHIIIHTSKLETFGIVALESLFVGRPVVAFDNSLPDEIKKLVGVYTSSQDTMSGLTTMLANLISNYSKINLEKISDTAQSVFNTSEIANNISSILTSHVRDF